MKSQPKPSMVSNDDVQTPDETASRLVQHFTPFSARGGTVTALEPCRGDGSFYRALTTHMEHENRFISHSLKPQYHADNLHRCDWCEIKEGRDFLSYSGRVDWIITNPPFSQCKAFMEKSFQVADNVVFLITLNHVLGLKARFRLLDTYGFGIAEAVLLDTPPPPWPSSGFQVGAVHFMRGYEGAMRWTDMRSNGGAA